MVPARTIIHQPPERIPHRKSCRQRHFSPPRPFVQIQEIARFPAYFNLLKQEYVSARYRLFVAIHNRAPSFIMREVLLLDGGEDQILGHQIEELRSAYRSAYSIFDKIGIFLNSYLKLGLKPKQVQFRHIWFQEQNNRTRQLKPIFEQSQNWALRGLFFLSKDLYDETFQEVRRTRCRQTQPTAKQIEHRFLILQQLSKETPRGDHWTISVRDFQQKTLRLLRLAREALFYLSITMCIEEHKREQEKDDTIRVVLKSKPIKPPNQLDSI